MTDIKCIVEPGEGSLVDKEYSCWIFEGEVLRMQEAAFNRKKNNIKIDSKFNKLKVFTGYEYALWSNVFVTEETRESPECFHEARNEYSYACGAYN